VSSAGGESGEAEADISWFRSELARLRFDLQGNSPRSIFVFSSDFGFEFAEIFVIEKRLGESGIFLLIYRKRFSILRAGSRSGSSNSK
jgi:hypothetical protein